VVFTNAYRESCIENLKALTGYDAAIDDNMLLQIYGAYQGLVQYLPEENRCPSQASVQALRYLKYPSYYRLDWDSIIALAGDWGSVPCFHLPLEKFLRFCVPAAVADSAALCRWYSMFPEMDIMTLVWNSHHKGRPTAYCVMVY